jgi:hypothetical protein
MKRKRPSGGGKASRLDVTGQIGIISECGIIAAIEPTVRCAIGGRRSQSNLVAEENYDTTFAARSRSRIQL